MTKAIFARVMWVGRATVFLVGLAVILAVMFGVASMAFAANGDPWILGQNNAATAITRLAGGVGVDGPMLQLDNNNDGTNATALDLEVEQGKPPMRVNSQYKVVNLNADQVDNRSVNQLAAAALGSNGTKAADSDKLDGLNQSDFIHSDVIKRETAQSTGTALSDGTRYLDGSCPMSSSAFQLLSGGPANIDKGTVLLESFPISANTWRVRIENNGTLDSFSVVMLCAPTSL
jgi:hypothetical protein